MDFEKLNLQRAAKAAAAGQPDTPEPKAVAAPEVTNATPAKRNRARVKGSKRNDENRTLRAWYIENEQLDRLKDFVYQQQRAGEAVDASDVVNEAIKNLLDQKGEGA